MAGAERLPIMEDYSGGFKSDYFPANETFSAYYVPLDVIHATDKGLKVGYVGEGGKERFIWVAKRLVYDERRNTAHLYDGEPKTTLKVASRVFHDSEEFMREYAEFIDKKVAEQKIKKSEEEFRRTRESARKLAAALDGLLDWAGVKHSPPSASGGTATAALDSGGEVVATVGVAYATLRVAGKETRMAAGDFYSGARGTGPLRAALTLAAAGGGDVQKLLSEAEAGLLAFLKGHDWSFDMSDDPSKFRSGSLSEDRIREYMAIMREFGAGERASTLYGEYER